MTRSNSVKQKKIFVLDTSVILYDHLAITNFDEHDIAIPIQVLEELDNFKKGNQTTNFEARQFFRELDEIAKERLINEWVPINGKNTGKIKVFLEPETNNRNSSTVFNSKKNDHLILDIAQDLQRRYKARKVVLVSKDVCLRLKAKALNLNAEDYETGKIKNVEDLYKGNTKVENIESATIDKIFKRGELDPMHITDINFNDNEYVMLKNGKKSALAYFHPIAGKLKRIEKVRAFNIEPKNAEQTFAMHALLNPAVKLVTLQGVAGTGKTLMAMACALEQKKEYRQIYITRPVIPLSNKDLGYLPGDIKSKMDPYMQPIWDSLNVIKNQSGNERIASKIDALIETEKIAIAPLAYIRGRSLSKILFIVDEAQNLTPHEVKTIISRAGEGTKIVFMGDIHQIDTPYLDSESNGLSYLIDKVKSNPLFAHVTLEKGERSELANLAIDYL